QNRLMNFVIVGGGATGVELAGALAELKQHVLPNDYPDLDIRNRQGHTALSLCVQEDWVEGVEVLLQFREQRGAPPLAGSLMNVGVQSRSVGAVRLLMSKGMGMPDERTDAPDAKTDAPEEKGDVPDAYMDAVVGDDPAFWMAVKEPKRIQASVKRCIMGMIDNKPKKIEAALKELDLHLRYPVNLALHNIHLQGQFRLLDIAILLNKPDIIKALVEAGSSLTRPGSNGLTPLHLMAGKKMGPLLNHFLQNNDPNIVDEDGLTLLHVAVIAKDLDMVRMLQGHGVELLPVDKDGQTPYHLSALEGDLDMMKWSIDQNINSDIPDKRNITPMGYAILKGHQQLVEFLCQKGVKLDRKVSETQCTYLHLALENKHEGIAWVLLRYGVSSRIPNTKGVLPIHIAAKNGLVSMVTLLAGESSHIDVGDSSGKSSLHYAGLSDSDRTTEALIGRHADWELEAVPSVTSDDDEAPKGLKPHDVMAVRGNYAALKKIQEKKDFRQMTPDERNRFLRHAASGGCVEILKTCQEMGLLDDSEAVKMPILIAAQQSYIALLDIFVKSGHSLDGSLMDGLSALHLASREGAQKSIHYLLGHEVDAKAEALDGGTPIQEAVKNGHITETDILAPFSPIDQTDNQGQTLLHLAVESGKIGIVGQMIQMGVDVNQKDISGQTALHKAVTQNPDAIPYLLAAGADPRVTDSDGKTALEMAISVICPKSQLIHRYFDFWNTNRFNPDLLLHQALLLKNTQGFMFLASDSDLDVRDGAGGTLVHLAV
ncbi:MAG: ankyrin repeat domain-containing protein, partial [Candidatus Margulisbacteria bacterium]|nr:ankyrin repeat domain-containing protein [Candidatus Margulisiibacteriota bacterium]